MFFLCRFYYNLIKSSILKKSGDPTNKTTAHHDPQTSHGRCRPTAPALLYVFGVPAMPDACPLVSHMQM